MSLVYKNDTYSYNGEYEMGSLNKIAQAERRLSAKKQVISLKKMMKQILFRMCLKKLK